MEKMVTEDLDEEDMESDSTHFQREKKERFVLPELGETFYATITYRKLFLSPSSAHQKRERKIDFSCIERKEGISMAFCCCSFLCVLP